MKDEFVMVPREPTQEMISAALGHLYAHFAKEGQRPFGQFVPGHTADESELACQQWYGPDRLGNAYAAMLASAPACQSPMPPVSNEFVAPGCEQFDTERDEELRDKAAEEGMTQAQIREADNIRRSMNQTVRTYMAGYEDGLAAPASQAAGAVSCTCHPDDNPPKPCPRKYALTDCKAPASGLSEAERLGNVAAVLEEYADLQQMVEASGGTFPVQINGAYPTQSLRNLAAWLRGLATVDDAMVERACEGLQRANFPEGTMRDSSWISRPLIRAALEAALGVKK